MKKEGRRQEAGGRRQEAQYQGSREGRGAGVAGVAGEKGIFLCLCLD